VCLVICCLNNNDVSGNPNFGTVLKLAGPKTNPVLNQVASLATGQPADGQLPVPNLAVVRDGANICVFLAETTPPPTGSNAISAFVYPGGAMVGVYVDQNAGNSSARIAMVATGGVLYADYAGFNIGSWQMQPGCKLTLLQTTNTFGAGSPWQLAATPDGKTLVLSSSGDGCCVESFSIGANGALTERGPLHVNGYPIGVDITADSKYAIFAATPFWGFIYLTTQNIMVLEVLYVWGLYQLIRLLFSR